jgi:DNA-binding transcriptional MerR regulator
MDIESIQASRSTVERALNLFMDHDSKTAIAKQVGVSRRTLHGWAKNGVLTDGEPWNEYREKQEAIQEMDQRAKTLQPEVERIDDFYDENRDNLRTALTNLTEDMAKGTVELKPNDAQVIYKLIQRIDNRTERFQMFINRVLKDWFKAARKMLGKEEFQMLVQKKKDLEMGVATEFDELDADAVLSSNASMNVEYDEE